MIQIVFYDWHNRKKQLYNYLIDDINRSNQIFELGLIVDIKSYLIHDLCRKCLRGDFLEILR